LAFWFGTSFLHKDNDGNETVILLPWIAESLCIGITILAALYAKNTFDYAKQHRKDRADLREVILEDMASIEAKYPQNKTATQS
jgi:hypothetical protein